MKTISLRLYVAGQSTYGLEARENLQALIDAFVGYTFNVEVIDVLENPKAAIEDRVIASPTLIKTQPLPTCRIVGDLSDTNRVIRALSLRPEDMGAKSESNASQ